MLNLIIVRHAKSLHEEYVQNDIERHLAPRGYHEAQLSAFWCKKNGVNPGQFVSSPAIRAFSTAIIFANILNYSPGNIVLNSSIYEAEVDALLKVINEFDDNHNSIIMFGHNPGLADLINNLCKSVISELPTAAVVILKISESSWSKVRPGCAKLSMSHVNDR